MKYRNVKYGEFILAALGIIGAIAIAVVIFVLAALLLIWSANTLFPALVIPYTVKTVAAVIVVLVLLRGEIVRKS